MEVEGEAATQQETKSVTLFEGTEKSCLNKTTELGPSEDGQPAADTRTRMEKFETIMRMISERFPPYCINRFSSDFLENVIYGNVSVDEIRQKLLQSFQTFIQEDITKLMEEGKLELNFNKLDKLEEAAMGNQEPAWRPSGDPNQDVCSHLIQYNQRQESHMKKRLKNIKAENADLAKKVQAGRERIAQSEDLSATIEEMKTSLSEFRKLAFLNTAEDVYSSTESTEQTFLPII